MTEQRQSSSSFHRVAEPLLFAFPTPDDLSQGLAAFVVKAQDEVLARRDTFKVAISGGSLPKLLGQNLVGREGLKWEQWEVFLADERLVPLEHEDSNYRLIKEHILDKALIPADKVHPIDVSLLEDAEECADQYEKQLMECFAGKNSVAFPKFDLILLGMGPDGHTCSLFPGHPLLDEDLRWVAHIEDSPKPPPRRITLTYPVLNHANRAVFVVSGAGKQEMMTKVFDDEATKKELPCARVKPVNPGRVYWFTDEAATGHVAYPKTKFNPDEAVLSSIQQKL